jgi:PAS domain S-box-containing protein
MRHVYPAVGVALAYLIVGRLSLLLAIPPGFASPVWPAAGIALAGVLVWGMRALPGVAIGSFAVNLVAGLTVGGAPDFLAATPVAVGVAAGATLQTAFAVVLLRRFLPVTSWHLESGREIGLLVLIGGPVSALVNALIGPTVLQAAGLIEGPAFGVNVFTWWVGDAIGAIVIAPVALLLLSSEGVSRARKAAVALPMLMIFIGAIAAFTTTRHYGVENARTAFDRLATNHQFTLVKHLGDLERLLLAMDGLFSAQPDTGREEFHRFTERAFEGFEGIQALEWVPRVPEAQRAAYEARAHADGLADFRFKHIADGVVEEPASMAEYFPVYYVEPMAGNEPALGLVSSSTAPSRQATIDAARDDGGFVIAEPVRLVQETGAQAGLLLFSPVYRSGGVPETLEGRRENLLGVTEAVVRMGDFLNSVLPAVGSDYDLHIRDTNASMDRWDVYGSQPAPNLLAVRYSIEVGGRAWAVTFTPTAQFYGQRMDWTSWIVLTTGLLMVSLLGVVLLHMTARTDIIGRMVDAKTDELSALSKQLRSVLNNAGDGIVSADSSGGNLVVNASAIRLLGYEGDDLAGVAITDLVEPLVGQAANTATSGASLPNEAQRGRFRHKDGTAFIGEYTKSAVYDDAGVPSGVVIVFRDITARVDAEMRVREATQKTDRALRELRQQEERFRTLVGNIPGAVYRCDADDDWTMRYLSDFIEQITGYPAAEFVDSKARTFFSIIHPDDVGEVQRAVAEGVNGSGYFVAQYRIACKNGEERWVFERGHALKDESGQVKHLDGFILDITDRQAAVTERERLISDLSDANEELGRFAHVASHDLKEPLRAVAGFTRLLESRHGEVMDASGREYLHHIMQASDRMQALIADLLVYARIGHEATEGFETVDLGSVMTDVVQNLSGAISDSEAIVDVGTMPRVQGNPIQLMRVMQNLVGNALKYHTPNSPPKIAVACVDTDQYWLISVSDDGIGIPAEQRDLVFAPFERLHSQVEYSGTGLGLAICRKIVESHDGLMSVAANAPRGSVFTVKLPKLSA